MYRETIERKPASLALAGLVLSLPALILCSGGILQSVFGMRSFNESIDYSNILFSPVVLLGGLFAGCLLNVLSVFRLKFEKGSLVGTVLFKDRIFNLTADRSMLPAGDDHIPLRPG